MRSGHHKILTDFLLWLDGGPAPETALDDNINSSIMVFMAIESARGKTTQYSKDFLG